MADCGVFEKAQAEPFEIRRLEGETVEPSIDSEVLWLIETCRRELSREDDLFDIVLVDRYVTSDRLIALDYLWYSISDSTLVVIFDPENRQVVQSCIRRVDGLCRGSMKEFIDGVAD